MLINRASNISTSLYQPKKIEFQAVVLFKEVRMSFDTSSFPTLTSNQTNPLPKTSKTRLGQTKRVSQADRKKLAAQMKRQHEILETSKRELSSDPGNKAAQENLVQAQRLLDQSSGRNLLGCITMGADPRLQGKTEPVILPKPLPDPMNDLKSNIFPLPREETEEESALALIRVQAGNNLRPQPIVILPARIRHRVCPDAKQGNICHRGTDCDGAHSLAEYKPPECRHGYKCRFVSFTKNGICNAVDQPCGFIHPSEALEDYYTRSGRCPPVFKKRKGSRKPRVVE